MKRTTGYNGTFTIGVVSCSADSLVLTESYVLRINISAEKPAHRKALSAILKDTSATNNKLKNHRKFDK